MSFIAKLNIDGEEFNVLECDFGVTQNSDESGRPSAKPKAGQIHLLIESTTKIDFFEWAISNTSTKKGEITFFRRDNISSLKKLEFTDAYCIEYREQFNAVDAQPLSTFLVISAKEISMKGITYANNWPSKAS